MKLLSKLAAIAFAALFVSICFNSEVKAEAVYVVNPGSTVLTSTQNPLYYATGPFVLNSVPQNFDSYNAWAYYQNAYTLAPGTNPYYWSNPWIYTTNATYAPIVPPVNVYASIYPTVPYYIYYDARSSVNALPYGYWF